MRTDDLHAVKSELEQLNVELKRFKKELLTTRIRKLERPVDLPRRRPYPGIQEIKDIDLL